MSSIGKLRLKIPWKSLYSSPIVAEIDGLYAIVEPATGIIYNTLPLYNMHKPVCILSQHLSTMLKRVPKRVKSGRTNS